MKLCYKPKKFKGSSMKIIEQANDIVVEYMLQGLNLTLRQLYYQFVARDILENTQQSYARLGSIINDARLAGMLDWEAVEDRTRNLNGNIHEESPEAAIEDLAKYFTIDKWRTQPKRVEVWVEKEALIGVFEGICRELDVDFFACRGFVSQSEMWRAAQRMRRYMDDQQSPVILHFGDHDPSGLDMTRDIEDRFSLFGAEVEVERIALNMDQIERYRPPPNYAKATDSRFAGYAEKFGTESWELDALEPIVLRNLVRDHVFEHRDVDLWDKMVKKEAAQRQQLEDISEQWSDVVEQFC
jgi:hypothetical protein